MKKINQLLLILLGVVLFSGVGSAVVTITAGENITVTGSGEINISYINTTVNNVKNITQTGDKEYTLYVPLYFNSANLNITISDTDVSWLKLNGTSTMWMLTSSAPSRFIINNTKISSWKDTDYNYDSTTRSSIAVSGSRIFIENSSFLYLGDTTWITPISTYGVLFNGGGGVNSYVKSSNFTGNYMSMHIASSGMNNANITNNYFYNNSYNDIYMSLSGTGSKNITIEGNQFINPNIPTGKHGGIEMLDQTSNSLGFIIRNNTFVLFNQTINGAMILKGNNFLVTQNTINGSGSLYEHGIRTQDLTNSTISHNTIRTTQYSLYIIDSTNLTIFNNTFSGNDMGSSVRQSNSIFYENNTFRNNTLDVDSYNLGLLIFNTSNTYVKWNNFTEVATVGIMSQGTYNTTVLGNFFDFIPLSERVNYKSHDGAEPRCAIQSTKRYKGFFNQFGNNNFTISGNTFDSDTPCYLHAENLTRPTLDLTNYWYDSFQINTTFSNSPFEFYIPNYYNNLSWWHRISGAIRYNHKISDGNRDTQLYVEHNLSKDYHWFNNINSTNIFQINLYNKTNALIYFSNNSVACSNINSCDGNINITLSPNNYSYVLDNFNLTEGVSRQNSPLWFAQATLTENYGRTLVKTYTLMSNLTDTLNNLSFVATADCPRELDTAIYTSNSGVTYTPQFTCSGNQVHFTINNYESSNSSNTLKITYNPQGIGGSPSGGGDFITLALNRTNQTNQTTNKTIEDIVTKEEVKCELSSLESIKMCFLDIIEDIWPGKSLRNFALFLIMASIIIIIFINITKEWRLKNRKS